MKREIHPAVYMMASARNGTLYIGVTSNLAQRVWQHREGIAASFTSQYGIKLLVWYEQHHTMENAIAREKTLKKWNRAWKLRLIETANPDWKDLWPDIIGATTHVSEVVRTLDSCPQPNHLRAGPCGNGEGVLRGNDEKTLHGNGEATQIHRV